MANQNVQKDVTIFRIKTSKKEIETTVNFFLAGKLDSERINEIVKKIITISHAINFITKNYGTKIPAHETILKNEKVLFIYPRNILFSAIDLISRHHDLPAQTKINNIIPAFIKKAIIL